MLKIYTEKEKKKKTTAFFKWGRTVESDLQ